MAGTFPGRTHGTGHDSNQRGFHHWNCVEKEKGFLMIGATSTYLVGDKRINISLCLRGSVRVEEVLDSSD